MWEIFLTTYSIVLTALCGYVVHELKENRKAIKEENERKQAQEQAQCDALRALLRKNLVDLHSKAMDKGSITLGDLESGKGMYKAYKALGGNGVVEHMDKDIDSLPIEN